MSSGSYRCMIALRYVSATSIVPSRLRISGPCTMVAVPLAAAGLDEGPDCWADGAASDGLAADEPGADESAGFPGAAEEQAVSAPTAARAALADSVLRNRR